MAKKKPDIAAIAAQQRWIEEHGGDRAGYVERYGDPDLPYCYGNGGSAIYAADKAELDRLEGTS